MHKFLAGVVLIATLSLCLPLSFAHAAPGDTIVRIPRLFYNTNGVLFDGSHIRLSHFPANPTQGRHGEIVTVDESAGTVLSTICVHDTVYACGTLGVGGIAWDSNRFAIWATVTDFTLTGGNFNWTVRLFDPVDGHALQTCGKIDPLIVGDAYGLGYDAATDTLWYDGDKPVSYHLSTSTCKVLDTMPSPGVATESTDAASGSCFFRSYSDPSDPLAKRGADNLLAQMKADGTVIWKARTVTAEDNAYEKVGRYGVPVMWVVDDSDDSITAFEVPSTDCTPPLAVTWRYYYALCTKPVTIRWETMSETDTLGFVVERSYAKSGPFAFVGQLEAHGPFTPYEWRDALIAPLKTPWYRIREIASSGPGNVTIPFTTESSCVRFPNSSLPIVFTNLGSAILEK